MRRLVIPTHASDSHCGLAPPPLLQRECYAEVALALKGGPWREPSMRMFAAAFGMLEAQDGVDESDDIRALRKAALNSAAFASLQRMHERLRRVASLCEVARSSRASMRRAESSKDMHAVSATHVDVEIAP